jgi:hypothetical protein
MKVPYQLASLSLPRSGAFTLNGGLIVSVVALLFVVVVVCH